MNTRTIPLVAICIAIVTTFVSTARVPIAATGGFTHPGAIAEIFVALAFGPIVGMIAAGVGAAIADLISGYASFAPLTLVAHGLLGFLAGWLGWKKGQAAMFTGWIVGGLALVAVYFIGEATVYGMGDVAGAEVPINLLQVGLGIVGIGLFVWMKRSYPQIEQLAGDVSFTEEPTAEDVTFTEEPTS
jgi:energy-coupling factor transport system substrate-specific component